MRGDVGELLEIPVGSLQLACLRLQLCTCALHGRQLAHDDLPHRFDISLDLDDLACAADERQRRVVPTAGDALNLLAQAGQRGGDDQPQQHRGPDQPGEDRCPGGHERDRELMSGVKQLRPSLRPARGGGVLSRVSDLRMASNRLLPSASSPGVERVPLSTGAA